MVGLPAQKQTTVKEFTIIAAASLCVRTGR